MRMFRWFASRTVRQAADMHKHVRKLLRAQRDILQQEAVAAVQKTLDELRRSLDDSVPAADLKRRMEALEAAANKWLKPYPSPAIRENIEVLLVAIAVAMGVRTFLLQPFKIPTGSMQPTLYGVTSENLRDRPDFQIPTGFERVKQRFQGVSYTHLKSKVDGRIEAIEKPRRLLIFNLWQRLKIGGEWHTIWFPPDYGNQDIKTRAEIREGQGFRRGEDVVKLKVRGGDHLFVDRLTYNFRRPRRGEIFVFETRGILELPQDQYYIKRLVALPNETVRIGDDQHLIIDDERLDASTPRFENVYTFSSTEPPGEEGGYFGHVNDRVGSLFRGGSQSLAPLFSDGNKPFLVPEHHYLAMGDNTLNSFDSRRWGPVSRTNVIGKAWFVYWPLTERFGWGFR